MSEIDIIEVFKGEAYELLDDLERCLLELESNPTDSDSISSVFRIMHTIKGSAAMVGLEKLSMFTHEIENLFETVRTGEQDINKDLIDYILEARDLMIKMLESPDSEFDEAINLLTKVKDISNHQELKNDVPIVKENKLFQIKFAPEQDIFTTGLNPLKLIKELVELDGESLVISRYNDIPSFKTFDPEMCYTNWEVYLQTTEGQNTIEDVFIFVDSSEITIKELNLDNKVDDSLMLGEVLVGAGKLTEKDLDEVLFSQPRLGEILVKQSKLSEIELEDALKTQKFINNTKIKTKDKRVQTSIRVDSEKLDNLIDLVGEIVTIHAQMLQLPNNKVDGKQLSIVERFGHLSEELRNNAMSLRMVPIGTTFSRFNRLVRDLSSELGKKIKLETFGSDTELDKNVIEKLSDPLVHIIRNSIDHGIEIPKDRVNSNKSEEGTIKLSAIHSGSSVNIIIEDDGKGLDRKRIRAKAIEKDLLGEDEIISDEKLLLMIFSPGFSTSDEVTKVSGRGVGMDVVYKQIEALKGSVNIESVEGKHTRISLFLPITLAIVEGLLTKVAQESFVIPLSYVESCLEISKEDKEINGDRNLITYRDSLIPYIDLRKLFSIRDKRERIEQIVVVKINNSIIGLLVDKVVGGNQTVIKPLGDMYKHMNEIAGATILGNGSIALVLDIEKLYAVAHNV